jgi:hypothetical protein
VYLTYVAAGINPDTAVLTQEAEKTFDEVLPLAMKVVGAWRFGEHYTMILLIPVILLFSYTRNHKNMKADTFIPIGGVVLALLVAIEGTYQGIVMNLPILVNKITEMAAKFLK